MLSSEAVTPLALARAITASAESFGSADRMARTTGAADGPAFVAGAAVRWAAAAAGFGAETGFGADAAFVAVAGFAAAGGLAVGAGFDGGGATAGFGPARMAAFFLSRLRRAWTVVRMASSGAFTP